MLVSGVPAVGMIQDLISIAALLLCNEWHNNVRDTKKQQNIILPVNVFISKLRIYFLLPLKNKIKQNKEQTSKQVYRKWKPCTNNHVEKVTHKKQKPEQNLCAEKNCNSWTITWKWVVVDQIKARSSIKAGMDRGILLQASPTDGLRYIIIQLP